MVRNGYKQNHPYGTDLSPPGSTLIVHNNISNNKITLSFILFHKMGFAGRNAQGTRWQWRESPHAAVIT